MIAYLKSLLPNQTPANIAERGRFATLQERILQWVLLILVALGAAGLGAVIYYSARSRSWGQIVLPVLLYAGLLAVTLLRNRSYAVRAGTLLAILFMLDTQLLLRSGMTTGTLPFFFATIFLSGLFFGIEMAAAVFGLGAAMGLTSIFTPGSPWKALFDSILQQHANSETMISMLAFAAAGGLAILSVILMNRELNRSVRNEIEAGERLERESKVIEARIRESSQVYQQRLEEARIASEITRVVSSILDPDQLLQEVVDLLQDRFRLYYVGAFVLDAERRFAVLKAGTGEAGRKMLADGHRLPVSSTSMIGWVSINRQARVALDAGKEAVRFNNPNLPFTRSELALPVTARGEVLGALTVQSNQPNAFSEDDILILQGIADSLAVALENARLYRQSQEMLNEVKQYNQQYLENAWAETARLSGSLLFSFDNEGENPEEQGELKTHEFPLLLRDQVIGYIALESEREQLSAEETAFIEAVTSQTAVALENARLLEESQRHAFEEQKLNEITERFSQASTVEDILKIAVKELGDLPYATQASIHLAAPEESAGENGRVKERAA